MEPVRPATVVVNNTTIINKTVIKVAPATAVIEKASGRKVQVVQVQELRHKEEAPVVAMQRTRTSTSEQKVQTPVRSVAGPNEKKTVVAHALPRVESPAAATHGSAAPAPKKSKAQGEARKSVPAAAESKSEGNHPAAIKEPTRQIANKPPVKQAESARPANNKAQRVQEQPAKEKPAISENNGPNTADKSHENKGKEQ
jgi:hypothetical protein